MNAKSLNVILSGAKDMLLVVILSASQRFSVNSAKNLIFAQNKLRSEKGFILILALVSMVAMSIIGISLITNMTTDVQLAGNERQGKVAFEYADAGINEGMARLRLSVANARYVGEPANTPLYRTSAVVLTNPTFNSTGTFNNTGDAVQHYSVTTSYLIEGMPYCDSNSLSVPNIASNTPVNATTGAPDPQNCNSEVVMFGKDFNFPSTLTSLSIGTNPIYRIVSVGTYGTTTRTIEAYVGRSTLNLDPGAAANLNGCATLSGSKAELEAEGGASVPGLQYLGACAGGGNMVNATNCPTVDTGNGKVEGGCVAKTSSTNLNTYLGKSLTDVKTLATLTLDCNSVATCANVISGPANTTAIWGDCAGGTSSALIYVTSTNPVNLSSGDLPSGCGRGVLVVDGGSLTIGPNVEWQGLIYVVSGDVTMNGGGGNSEVKGGIMAGGNLSLNGGGGPEAEIEYDAQILLDVAKQINNGSFSTLVLWRRL